MVTRFVLQALFYFFIEETFYFIIPGPHVTVYTRARNHTSLNKKGADCKNSAPGIIRTL